MIISMEKPVYKRILLKLSGEALQPKGGEGILDFEFMSRIAAVLKKCHDLGVEIGIVVGGGNIWRGAKNPNFDRCRADSMGMLATVINSLGLQDTFIQAGLDTCVMTSVEMQAFADRYTARHAREELAAGKVVIFGGGLGSPYFSTDTAATLRAAEIGADAILMAKNIDGVYDSDPKNNPDAKKFDDLTYDKIIELGLRAFDLSAMMFCAENKIESYAFALADPENIYRVVTGQCVGTRMHN